MPEYTALKTTVCTRMPGRKACKYSSVEPAERTAEHEREEQREHGGCHHEIEQLLGKVLELQRRAPAEGECVRQRGRRRRPSHGGQVPEVGLRWVRSWGFLATRAIRQREEDFVQAGLTQAEVRHLDARIDQGSQCGWRCPGCSCGTKRARSLRRSASPDSKLGFQKPVAASMASGWARVTCENPRADLGLQLATGAFGNLLAVVDDRDASGKLIGLLKYCVVSKMENAGRREFADEAPNALARFGIKPVVGSSRNKTPGVTTSDAAMSRRRRMPPE